MYDGTGSLKITFTDTAAETYSVFHNYEKDYGLLYGDQSTIQVKTWVKTNRTSTFEVQATVVLIDEITDVDNPVSSSPSATLTTTKTDGSWEELVFDIPIKWQTKP